MKKILLIHTAIVLYAVLIIPGAFCQTITAFAKTEAKVPETAKQLDREKFPLPAAIEKLNDISIKAVRAFIQMFENAKNVTWQQTTKGGCVAQFTNDSIQTMAGYKADGSWNYILKRYNEKKMSPDLRRIVKSTFFDYTIMEVTEITLPYNQDNIIYSVMIKNGDNFKILRVYNGEMEVLGDYRKP